LPRQSPAIHSTSIPTHLSDRADRDSGLFRVGIITIGLERAISALPNRRKSLRAFLLGNTNIEGVWLELVLDEHKALYQIAYCFIRVVNEMFVLDGLCFLVPGGQIDRWKSVYSNLNSDGDLDLTYKVTSAKTGSGDFLGYSKYTFTINPDRIRPMSYTGSFKYPLDGRTYFVEGRRIADKTQALEIQRDSNVDLGGVKNSP
jgi:hypothetical protein